MEGNPPLTSRSLYFLHYGAPRNVYTKSLTLTLLMWQGWEEKVLLKYE